MASEGDYAVPPQLGSPISRFLLRQRNPLKLRPLKACVGKKTTHVAINNQRGLCRRVARSYRDGYTTNMKHIKYTINRVYRHPDSEKEQVLQVDLQKSCSCRLARKGF
jgi:hypothetical protein